MRNSKIFAGFALMAMAALPLAGCGMGPNPPSSTGAIDTGTYPNLNIKPGVANAQFTAQQKAAKAAELRAAQAANRKQGAVRPPNDIALLRKLGQTHAKEAIAEIEGK